MLIFGFLELWDFKSIDSVLDLDSIRILLLIFFSGIESSISGRPGDGCTLAIRNIIRMNMW